MMHQVHPYQIPPQSRVYPLQKAPEARRLFGARSSLTALADLDFGRMRGLFLRHVAVTSGEEVLLFSCRISTGSCREGPSDSLRLGGSAISGEARKQETTCCSLWTFRVSEALGSCTIPGQTRDAAVFTVLEASGSQLVAESISCC